MPSDPIVHSVFVDFENVPDVDLQPIAGKAAHVTLLIGKKQTWLDLTLVQQIRQLHDYVELIEVGASGHNALDLTLGYYLGQAVQSAPGRQFYIVSKDKDFDPMIAHLQAKGVQVTRHDTFAGLPFLGARKSALSKPPFAVTRLPAKTPAVAKTKPATDKFEKFVQHLRNSPPANKTKLEHMLEAYFKPSLPAGGKKGVIAELRKRLVLDIDSAGKVVVHKA